jgi:hypothetical protein
VRAPQDVRDTRAGTVGDIRVHRVLLQQAEDALGAGLHESDGVYGIRDSSWDDVGCV